MTNIRKTVIPKSQLPNVTSDNKYNVRFRIVSDDQNRRSHWSPVATILGNPITPVSGESTYADGIINVVWDDALNYPEYDIFIRWDYNETTNPTSFFYHGTSTVHNYQLLSEATVQYDVIVQVASIEKEVSPTLEVFSQTVIV